MWYKVLRNLAATMLATALGFAGHLLLQVPQARHTLAILTTPAHGTANNSFLVCKKAAHMKPTLSGLP